MANSVTTCGVLLFNSHGEVLLGHATGGRHWDVPKGVAEPGETPRATAVRETQEETGLTFDPDALHEVGHFKYRPGKDLQLYAILMERINPSTCRCTSQFRDAHGRLRPELDAFQWVAFDRVPELCAKNMAAVLTRSLSLPAVLQRLSA